jgi:hypothetical protein
MAKQTWLPRKEADRRTVLNHLSDQLPGTYATKYGITAGELTTLDDFRLWFNWTFTALETTRQNSQGLTGFRDDLCNGKSVPNGPLTLPPALNLPAQPARGTPPVAITPVANGWKFVASLVNRIKSHVAYTTADGDALKIEGAEQTGPDPETTKPAIKVVLVSGGQKEVQWKKLGFTALRIEVDRGNGQFVYLATDTEPHYIDTVTLPSGTAAVWRYRAIYLEGDQLFGQWSDVVSLAVQG